MTDSLEGLPFRIVCVTPFNQDVDSSLDSRQRILDFMSKAGGKLANE
jgi:hypothetical protein